MSQERPLRGDFQRRTEVPSGLVAGPTGELVNEKVKLFTDPVQGETWMSFGDKVNPRAHTQSLYERLGLIFAPKEDNWLHLIEHNLKVSANALTLGNMVREAGVSVNLNTLLQAGAIHDAGTRYNFEKKRKSREMEALEIDKGSNDTRVVDEMRRMGATDDAIKAGQNTGRLWDRKLLDPDERMDAIRSRSIEENILGYVDARTIDTDIVSLEEAQQHYLTRKKDPDSQYFFEYQWLQYYQDVERYLQEVTNGVFDPSALTDERVFEEVHAFVNA